jgi:UrcA family protein
MDTNASSPNTSPTGTTGSDLLAVAVSIGAVIWAATAGVASAQTTQPVVETISVADLDLSSADGMRAYFKRLDVAAQRACGGEPVRSPLTPREPARFEQCVKDAIAAAVRTADQPMVATLQELSGSSTLASR